MRTERIRRLWGLNLVFVISLLVAMMGCAEPELERIEVTPADKTLKVGESVQLQAEGVSTGDEELPLPELEWSVEGEAGSIDPSGRFTAEKPGQAAVVARAQEVTGQATITVEAIEVTKLELEAETTEATPEATVELTVAGFGPDGVPARYAEVVLSSPTEGAALSDQKLSLGESGRARFTLTVPSKPVETVVTAAADDVSREARIEVNPRSIAELRIEPEGPRAEVGAAVEFTIRGLAEDDEPAAYAGVTVSSPTEGIELEKTELSLDQKAEAGISVKVPTRPGKALVTFASEQTTQEITIDVVPRSVAEMEVEPEASRALAGTAVTVRVQALSADNQTAGFNEVKASSPTEGASLSASKLELGPDGRGELEVTLSPQPGMNTVAFKSGEVTRDVQIEGTQVTRLEIAPKASQFEIGQRVTFKASGYDQYGNKAPVDPDWSVSGENAVLREGGEVVMEELGSAIVMASYKGVSLGHPFNIVPGAPARLEIEPGSARLKAGETLSFEVQGFNAQDHPITVQVKWNVQGGIGNVTEDGVFTAVSVGEGSVVARSAEVQASADVAVEHGPIAGIRFRIDKKVVTAGETLALSAKGVDANGNTFPVDAEWLLGRSLGTIDRQESTFTPLHAGSGQIFASVGNIIKGAEIEVVPAELARIEIRPGSADIVAGEKIRFEVAGYDRFDNAIDVEPSFSLRDPLGTIDSSGVFRAEKSGNTVVEAKVRDLSARSNVAVAPAEMERVSLSPGEPVKLEAGNPRMFSASGFDRFGNTVETRVDWEVRPDLGDMDEQGVFTPKKVGKGKITATVVHLRTKKTLKDEVAVTVTPGETVQIQIQPSSAHVEAGEEKVFSATAYDAYGNKTGVELSWRVEDPLLGKFTEPGRFSAVKAGSGEVRASFGNVVGKADIKVAPSEIAFLKIVPEKISLEAGQAVSLQIVVEDRLGNVIEDPDVLWRLSDPSLGEVAEDRTLTAERAGQGRVIAVANNIVDMAPLRVRKGSLHSISLKPGSETVASGAQIRFSATALDAGGNPVEAPFTWSVDPSLGRIDDTGTFMALKTGSGKVTVRSGDVEATADITVVPGDPASISVEPEAFTVTAGKTQTLSARVLDQNENLIKFPKLEWKVLNELGTVDRRNVFHAQRTGEGSIRVAAGDVSAKIDATVEPGKVRVIDIEPDKILLRAGAKHSFSAKGFDGQGNEAPLDPVWSTTGMIGQVSETGELLATRTGKGFVVVKMNRATAVAAVEVLPGPVDSITVDPEEVVLKAGQTAALSARAFDAYGNVTPASLTWSLQAEKVIGVVTPQGYFQGMKTGTGSIVAAAEGVTGKAPVTVEPGEMRGVDLSPEQIRVKSGEKVQVSATGVDRFGNTFSVEPVFSVEPETLGSVDDQGVFQGLKAGNGLLYAEARDLLTAIPVEVSKGALKRLEIELPKPDIRAAHTYVLQAIGYDAGGNRLSPEAQWAVTPDIGWIEKETGRFHAGKSGKGMVVAHAEGTSAMKSVKVEPGELYSFFIEPNPVTVESSTLQNFEVNGFDAEGNPVSISVPSVEWATIGGVGEFESPGVFKGTKAGRGKVIAKSGALMAEAYVRVVPGQLELSNCRIRVTYPHLPADGKSFSEVIVEVRDAYFNPVPGAQVKLVSSRQVDEIVQPPETNRNGVARGRISSTRPGTSMIRAVVKGAAFDDAAWIEFK